MDNPRAAHDEQAQTAAAELLATARRGARAVARRAVHTARRDRRWQELEGRIRGRLLRPAVTVVLPVYNVEAYVAECLASIAAQTFTDYEVVVVDDGSKDGSMAIVEDHAARDRRIRVVHRRNGGLGAARNTGVQHARGTFLTFVDSDDALPPRALEVLVGSARASGSQVVIGGVRRFNATEAWVPTWVPKVHGQRLTGITLGEFLPVLRNLYTWDKLFRRDWFVEQGLSFREGVPYEDQPIITQLIDRAPSIDVIPDVVYLYRQREDQSSISQQTATVPDLQARVTAWELTRDVLRDEADPAVYIAWLQTLFDSHFHWYLQSRGTGDPTYWRILQTAIVNLTETAPQAVWDATAPDKRVVLELARQGRLDDLEEFMRLEARRWDKWPARVRADGVELELPFHDDPALDPELFLLRPTQVRVSHAVEHAHWLRDADGDADPATADSTLQLSGWAYLGKVDLSTYASQVVVVLRGPDGEERRFPSTASPPGAYPPPLDDVWCDYRPGTFQVELPLHEVMATTPPDQSWSVLLEVSAAGFSATSPASVLLRSGCAGVLPAGHLPNGDRLIPDWSHGEPLRVRRQPSPVQVVDPRLEDGWLTGSLDEPGPEVAVRVRVETSGQVAEGPVQVGTDGVRRFRVELPRPVAAHPGRPTWCGVSGVGRDGAVTPLAAPGAPGVLDRAQYADGAVTLERTRRATLAAVHWPYGAQVEQLDVSVDGEVTFSGSVFGEDVRALSLVSRHKKAQAASAVVPVSDGRFTATVPLRRDLYRFGSLPLPIGNHDLHVRLTVDGEPTPREVPLRMSAALDHSLPVRLRTAHYEGRIVRGPDTGTRLTLVRPLGEDAGTYRQHQLRSRPRSGTLHRGLLVRSYFGELATDNGVAVQEELARRGSDLPVYWAVQDHSIPVPEGGIRVIVNSAEHHELLSSVRYYLDNMFQPDHHVKPEGQVIVQTFHGYPFKQMGQPHWERVGFSRARIRSYHRRAAEWDYVVSPATYATPWLRKHFGYEGEMLEIGYPRNDVLQSEDAPRLREVVRASLGLRPEQRAVLYAPTFRDYLSRDDNKARMGDFFDFEGAHRRLGDGVVILVRGHAFNARSNDRVGNLPGTIDVTDYPEVADLYLAADAAVVDYSSLRFDFGVTGKPMIFHVPDRERYVETRGWLFDFEPTAPGPMVDTTDEVVDQLLDLEGVVRRHRESYAAFRRTYLDLEDGHAARRFVDRVFVPRGDAPGVPAGAGDVR